MEAVVHYASRTSLSATLKPLTVSAAAVCHFEQRPAFRYFHNIQRRTCCLNEKGETHCGHIIVDGLQPESQIHMLLQSFTDLHTVFIMCRLRLKTHQTHSNTLHSLSYCGLNIVLISNEPS